MSFPSGHTSTMFATAQSSADFYGWPAGVPLFTLAVYTGVSRIFVNAHHLSDVIFGATLGSVIAHGYSVYHLKNIKTENSKNNTKTLTVYPYYEARNEFGLEILAQF